ncbi:MULTISPECIES: hypothetical protein [Amniculibacterium]|mgnify:CR=1 FL=1|uniref:hypothetical protein n=1 Tax=Amniculibacterium TaxID=2715289 RepID=UPI000F5B1424|nr:MULTISPECIES: hypothetical protein [Amniculibacterium]
MKKIFFTLTLVFASAVAYAQTAYEKVMSEKIALLDKAQTADDYQKLMNDFDRIGTKEQKEWLPYYYSAYSALQKGRLEMRTGKTDNLDFYAGIGEKFANLANSINPSAENHILLKMSYTLRMLVNPQERYMTYGVKANEELAKAEKMDPNNPRISLLKAEDIYFTPAQFGGSKEKGLALFQKALDQYKAYKTSSTIAPNWGQAEAEYFLAKKP